MIHNYEVQFENVKLCQLRMLDIENLRLWRNDLNNFKYLRKIPYITEEQQKKWYESYIEDKTEMCFAIYETQVLNRMVGSLSLLNFDNDNVELGRVMVGDIEAHGKEVGKNAVVAALAICFWELNIRKVYLHVYKENISAYKTYKKVGMKIEKARNTDLGIEYLMTISLDEYRERWGVYFE